MLKVMSSLAHGKASSTSSALNAPQSKSKRTGQGEVRDETRVDGKAVPLGVWRLVLCRHFGFSAYFGTS